MFKNITSCQILKDILLLLYWVGLWNTTEHLVYNYIEPSYHLFAFTTIGIISFIGYYYL
jgi:hypothetical protein